MADLDPTHPSLASFRRRWALRGAREVIGVPGIVLMTAMIGFASLAREAGMTFGETVFATIAIWALPSSILLAGAVATGIGLVPLALAVALASVRFMPMTMAIVPAMRRSDTPTWKLLAVGHVVAITAWVHGLSRFAEVPREHRLAFFGAFAWTIALMSTALVAIFYEVSTTLPPVLAAGLVFLTPIYFLSALWSSTRVRYDRPALLLGLAMGPVAQAYFPSVGMIGAGLVGGTIAWAVWGRRA